MARPDKTTAFSLAGRRHRAKRARLQPSGEHELGHARADAAGRALFVREQLLRSAGLRPRGRVFGDRSRESLASSPLILNALAEEVINRSASAHPRPQ